MYLEVSFNVCGTWCSDFVDNPRSTLGRELVARVSHIWCDLCVLEYLAVRIPKDVFADKEAAGNRTWGRKNCSHSGRLFY